MWAFSQTEWLSLLKMEGGVSCGICQSDEGEPLNPALFAEKYFLQIFSILRHGVTGI